MTAQELDSYLEILQKHDVMSFAFKETFTDDTIVEFNVTIAPNTGVNIGTELTPGGWKTPANLDDPEKLFAPDKEPNF